MYGSFCCIAILTEFAVLLDLPSECHVYPGRHFWCSISLRPEFGLVSFFQLAMRLAKYRRSC